MLCNKVRIKKYTHVHFLDKLCRYSLQDCTSGQTDDVRTAAVTWLSHVWLTGLWRAVGSRRRVTLVADSQTDDEANDRQDDENDEDDTELLPSRLRLKHNGNVSASGVYVQQNDYALSIERDKLAKNDIVCSTPHVKHYSQNRQWWNTRVCL